MKKNSFQKRVLDFVSRIPRGTVLTYKEVAEGAGNPRAYRVVGSIMKQNLRKNIPCHRVVRSDLSIGEYNRGGERVKAQLLQKEGALDERGKIQRLTSHGKYISVIDAANLLKSGGVGIIPSDTLYGVMASALDERAVERVYTLRRRFPNKSCIILVATLADMGKFGIAFSGKRKQFLQKITPGPVSVVLPYASKKFAYLHRGTNALAFRVPNKKQLLDLIKKTGPLIAPSANMSGKPPALTIKEARRYFGDKADVYWDQGRKTGKPSTLIKLTDDGILELRSGAVPIHRLQKLYKSL